MVVDLDILVGSIWAAVLLVFIASKLRKFFGKRAGQ